MLTENRKERRCEGGGGGGGGLGREREIISLGTERKEREGERLLIENRIGREGGREIACELGD